MSQRENRYIGSQIVDEFPTFGRDIAMTCKNLKMVWCSVCKEEKSIEKTTYDYGMNVQCTASLGACTTLLGDEDKPKSYCADCQRVGTWRFEREEEET